MYAVLLVVIPIVCTSAIANTRVDDFFTGISSAIEEGVSELYTLDTEKTVTNLSSTNKTTASINKKEELVLTPMFATIINGADQEVTCSNGGITLAKFFLCGTGDDRTLSLSQSGSSYDWQKLTCSLVGTDTCPILDETCYTSVATTATFFLDASDANVDGDYRVRINSDSFYYFRVSSNPLNPQLSIDDIICGNPGRIEVTNVPSGYEYSLNSAAGPYQDTPYFDIATAGSYQIFTKLKNASSGTCIFPSAIETINAVDMSVSASMVDVACSGDQTGSISVDITGVPGFYSYKLIRNGVTIDTFGPNSSSSHTFDNLGSGTYSIEVQAGSSCTETVSTISGSPIVIGGGLDALGVIAFATDSFGCGAATVDITLNVTGGTAPYRYSLNSGALSATFSGSQTIVVSSAGSYSIEVFDANNCPKTAAVEVQNIPVPLYTINHTDVRCNGEDNGTITVNVTNSNGYNLRYSKDNGATFQNSNVFSNLAPGNYAIIVEYEQGVFSCETAAISESVSGISAIVGSASSTTNPTCLNESGGVITFSAASGGQGPYDYSIGAGFISGNTVFSNLSVGTYIPQIRDANNCIESLPAITFTSLNKPTDIAFTISSLDCTTGTASVSLSVSGGGTINTYEIISPTSTNNGSNNTFTGLGIGSYTFRVTNVDGCSYTESFAITDISSIGVARQLVSDVTCRTGTDGEGRFIVDGFAGTYSYQIGGNPVITGQSTNIIPLSGLVSGSYTIVVTDETTNCTDTVTLVISEPATALSISPIVTDMSCQNNNRGAVNANVSGGWGSNRYTLIRPVGAPLGPRSNPNFTGLTDPGMYTISVRDREGCVVDSNFTLTIISSPSLVLDTTTSDLCYDNSNASTINVTATGGDSNYEYRKNGGPWVASASFSNLLPGLYTIEVRDGNNCRDSITRRIRPQMTTVETIIQELECGGVSAEIQIDIANGNPPYASYEVSTDGGLTYTPGAVITGNSFVYDTPIAGTFWFRISDNLGCPVVTNAVVINTIEVIAALAPIVRNPVCNDINTGRVELVPDTSVGIPPYEYSTDDITYTNQAVYGNLAPGNYTYYIRDSRKCNVAVPFTIGAPDPGVDAMVVPNLAICNAGTTEGSIDVTGITNGVPDYTYVLLDVGGAAIATFGPTSSTTHSFLGIIPGDYTVVTTDAAGCEDRDQVTVGQTTVQVVPLSNIALDCVAGLSNTIEIQGGTGPFLIRLVGEAISRYAPNIPPRQHQFIGLNFNTTYFIEVEDTGTGCTYIEEIPPVTGPSPLSVVATATIASCNGFNGEFSYIVSGATGNINVVVINTVTGVTIYDPAGVEPTSDLIQGLPPGNYQVRVEDLNNSCTAAAEATILENTPSIVIDSNTNANCNNANGQIVFRAVGGTPTYSFAVVNSGASAPVLGDYTSDTVFNLASGTHDVYLRDAAGCTAQTTVTVTMDPGVITPTVNVINQCVAVASYNVLITAPLTVGSDIYEYDLSGTGFQSSPNFTINTPGSYVITVRDRFGCENTVIAEVFDYFSIGASATTLPTCNNSDAIITVDTTGGSGTFEYTLDDGINPAITQNNPIFNNLGPGVYTITVEDQLSNTIPLCVDVTTVEIVTVDVPVISSIDATDISCFGANDGSILVNLNPVTATDGPFTYTLYNSSNTIVAGPQSEAIFENLAPDVAGYEVEVISSRGCIVRSVSTSITEPTALQASGAAPPFSCNTSSNSFNTTILTVYNDTNGDGTGTITGTGPYSYSINDGTAVFDGTNFQINNTFEIIDNGTNQSITVTIRDYNGCEATDIVAINTPTDLTFTFSGTPMTCDASGSGSSPGTIRITIDQGAGNYVAEILPLGSNPVQSSGGNDYIEFSVNTPGDYIFAVRDINAGGCLFVTPTYTVSDFNVIEAIIAEEEPITCFNGNDGEISIEINNYSGIYNYEVFSRDSGGVETTTGVTGSFDTANPINTPEIITGLPSGTLIVRVEALGSPFCDTQSNVATVRAPDRALNVALLQTAVVTCFVPGRGQITATGDGGWGTYEYQLEIETTTPGTFTEERAFSSNAIFSDLLAGNYRVNIRDAEGCIVYRDILLDPPTAISGIINITQALQCPGSNNGIIELQNVVGGEDIDGDGAEYLFQLNREDSSGTIINSSGLQEAPIFPNLPAGYYTISVFDGWGCDFKSVPIYMQDPPPVTADLIETVAPGCGAGGEMRLTITNPVSGMEYFYRRSGTADVFVSFGGVDVLSVDIAILDVDVNPGPYQYDVINGNGCPQQQSNQISLDKALPLVVALNLVDANIKCANEATAIIRSEAFGGIGDYKYTLVNNDLNGGTRVPTAIDIVKPEQDSGIFRELIDGSYWVYAQSGGCSAVSGLVTISPITPLVLDRLDGIAVSCQGEVDGQVIIEASGGTGDIHFAISETLSEFFQGDDPLFPNRITFSDLPPGRYEIIVQDDVGCSILQEVIVSEPDMLIAAAVNTTPEVCINAENGSAQLSITGGTPFVDTGVNYYETKIIGPNSDGSEVYERNDALFFENLIGGETYVIFVRDASGCETNAIVPIEIGVDLASEAIIQYGCDGIFPNSTVTIQMQDTSLLSNLMFALDPIDATDAITSHAGTENVFGDLPAGDHIVYIYHENGCATLVEFRTDSHEPLTLEVEKTGPNEITAIAFGGYGGYEYFFQGDSQGDNTVFTLNKDATIEVKVVDQSGCVARVMMPFDFTGMVEIPNFFTPDGDNKNDTWHPLNRSFFANLEVKIYDRYGRVVAELNNVTSWDGTYHGNDLPMGDYWYVVNANDEDEQRYVGHFTLYR